MLVFDKWTCNCDSRQSVFHRTDGGSSARYKATMVDQGFCFNANEWSFPDAPLRGLYSRLTVYSGVQGLESFEPFLGRLENLEDDFLEEAASGVPPEWYEGKTEELSALVSELARRRGTEPIISAGFQSDISPKIDLCPSTPAAGRKRESRNPLIWASATSRSFVACGFQFSCTVSRRTWKI